MGQRDARPLVDRDVPGPAPCQRGLEPNEIHGVPPGEQLRRESLISRAVAQHSTSQQRLPRAPESADRVLLFPFLTGIRLGAATNKTRGYACGVEQGGLWSEEGRNLLLGSLFAEAARGPADPGPRRVPADVRVPPHVVAAVVQVVVAQHRLCRGRQACGGERRAWAAVRQRHCRGAARGESRV